MQVRIRSTTVVTALALLAFPATALAAPVVISKLKWSRRWMRSGENVVATYKASGNTTLSFAIVDSAGNKVRDLGDNVPISAGRHGVDWDGYADTTHALPDANYALVLTSSDPNGISGTTSGPIGIDDHGPAVRFGPLHLKRRKPLRITVTDAVSGVSRVTLLIDGRLILRRVERSVAIAYTPPGGWSRGRHTITVLARDRTYNLTRVTRKLVVRK